MQITTCGNACFIYCVETVENSRILSDHTAFHVEKNVDISCFGYQIVENSRPLAKFGGNFVHSRLEGSVLLD